MGTLNIKPASDCKYDIISLGEVMARLDPGDVRIREAQQFTLWEGGGEYNVARGGARVFGLRTAIVTAFPDNDLAHLLQSRIRAGGVDDRFIKWVPFDGVGREVRVGLNWTERGFGCRAALGVSDRGLSAASQLKKGDINWEKIFGEDGVRWFHCGGIFAALSATTPGIIMEAMQTAKKYGTIISYDLNFRPSLFKTLGGPEKAKEVNREIAPMVDVMFGNEEDFTMALGFEVAGLDSHCSNLDVGNFKAMIKEVATAYPTMKVVATTLRNAKTASKNDWGAILFQNGEFHEATLREDLEILDRVGGGDSFASGVIYGYLSGKSPLEAVEYGAAHGAFAMTTPGDTSMAKLEDVQRLVKGGNARVAR